MGRFVHWAAPAMLALSLYGTSAAAEPKDLITAAMRDQAVTTPVQVIVAQAEIKSNINPSNLAVATGGGMLGSLIESSVNSAKAKKAEVAIAPVRDALLGVDGDSLALATTKTAFAGTPWQFDGVYPLSKDSSPAGKSGILDASGAPRVMFVEYTYDMSPNFGEMRVVANIQIAAKALPVLPDGGTAKPDSRVKAKNLVYNRKVTSIVSLASAEKKKAANIAQWAANNGQLAISGLTQAFANLAEATRASLALDDAQVAAMAASTNKKAVIAGFKGRVQPNTKSGRTLLWGPGIIVIENVN